MPPEIQGLREDGERRAQEQRYREIREAEERGRVKQILDNRLRGHEEKLATLEQLAKKLAAGQVELEHRLEKIEKAFGEFTAVAQAMAASGITNRTFFLGIGVLLVTILGLFVGISH